MDSVVATEAATAMPSVVDCAICGPNTFFDHFLTITRLFDHYLTFHHARGSSTAPSAALAAHASERRTRAERLQETDLSQHFKTDSCDNLRDAEHQRAERDNPQGGLIYCSVCTPRFDTPSAMPSVVDCAIWARKRFLTII